MKKILGVAGALILAAIGVVLWQPSFAGVSCSLPYTLTNGTIADATQVMANYNALVTCLTNAAAAGANNDITSLSGLTTPINPTQGGSNVYLGSSPTISGNEIVISSTTPAGYSNTANYSVYFIAPGANVATETMNVNGQGIANIYKQSSIGPVPLVGGELQTGQIVWATFDGTEYQINPVPNVTAGYGLVVSGGAVQISQSAPPYGFGPCVNLQLNASVGSNLLTVAVKAASSGGDPSPTNPVLCSFRDTTLTAGDPVFVNIISPTSINTNATGASLGSKNSVPFKFWVVLFNNGGQGVIGLINCLQNTASNAIPAYGVLPLDETSPASTTAIGAAASSAGVIYTPNGVNLTSKAFRILGYLEYTSGLTTAGTYASAPNKLQLFGPGVRRPGDLVQQTPESFIVTPVNFTTSWQTLISNTITPTDVTNLIKVEEEGLAACGGILCSFQFARGATAISPSQLVPGLIPQILNRNDLPGSTSGVTYNFQGVTGSSTASWPGSSGDVLYGTGFGVMRIYEFSD